jgi:hypothetical protein
VAREVQLTAWLSHIPGWAGFAALKPDLRGRAMGVRRDPLFFCAESFRKFPKSESI